MGKIKLKVLEAQQDDVYKGVVRIDKDSMKELGVKRGNLILIKGDRETAAIVDNGYPADSDEKIIRIDGIIRRNAGISLGDTIEISKAEVKEAERVTIAPLQKGIMVQGEPESLKRGLLGRAIMKGDIVVLGGVEKRQDLLSDEFGEDINDMLGGMLGNLGFGNSKEGVGRIKFLVVSTKPNQPIIVTENTEIILRPKAIPTGKKLDKLEDQEEYLENKSLILELKNLPSDLKKYLELDNMSEFLKLVEGIEKNQIVNKFKDNLKTYYFLGDYYIIIDKKISKVSLSKKRI